MISYKQGETDVKEFIKQIEETFPGFHVEYSERENSVDSEYIDGFRIYTAQNTKFTTILFGKGAHMDFDNPKSLGRSRIYLKANSHLNISNSDVLNTIIEVSHHSSAGSVNIQDSYIQGGVLYYITKDFISTSFLINGSVIQQSTLRNTDLDFCTIYKSTTRDTFASFSSINRADIKSSSVKDAYIEGENIVSARHTCLCKGVYPKMKQLEQTRMLVPANCNAVSLALSLPNIKDLYEQPRTLTAVRTKHNVRYFIGCQSDISVGMFIARIFLYNNQSLSNNVKGLELLLAKYGIKHLNFNLEGIEFKPIARSIQSWCKQIAQVNPNRVNSDLAFMYDEYIRCCAAVKFQSIENAGFMLDTEKIDQENSKQKIDRIYKHYKEQLNHRFEYIKLIELIEAGTLLPFNEEME